MKTKKRDLRPRPRWWQAIKAFFGGYYWLPCSGCGEKFGGHEPHGSLYHGNGGGESVCMNCAAWGNKQSEKVWKTEGVIEINGKKL